MATPRIFQFFRDYFDSQRDTKILNANFEALEVLLNGRLQGSNIADDTITDENLAPGAVGDTELDNTSPTQPSSISATTGIKSNTGLAFIDLTWAQSGTVEVKEWEVRWRRQGETLYEYTRVGTQSIRIEGLFPNTTYEVGVQAVSRTDIQSGYAVADQVILTASDTVAPGQVSGLSIGAGFRTVTAAWSDINIQDLMHYEVQLDTAPTFNTGNLVTKVTNGTVVTFGNLVTGTTYYVRVRAVDLSSNVGIYSETVSDTTAQTQTPDYASLSVTEAVIANLAVSNAKIANLAVDSAKIADLAVGSAKIADLAVTTAKINTLAVTNAKINDLAVNKLTAGTLSAQVLLSGNIRTADSGARVVIDASGVKLYDSGNNVKVNLDVASGSGFFTGTITGSTITGGTIKTGSAGQRVEITSSFLNEISWYTGDASETFKGRVYAQRNFDLPTIFIQSPGFNTLSVSKIAVRGASSSGGAGFIELNVGDIDGLFKVSGSEINTRTKIKSIPDAAQSGDWASAGLVSQASGNRAKMALHVPGQVAPCLVATSLEGDKLNVTNTADNDFAPIQASSFVVPSLPESKRNVADLNRNKQRVRGLRPIRFKRMAEPACTVCNGTGVARVAVRFEDEEYKEGEGCPYCESQPGSPNLPIAVKRQYEKDYIGLSLPEVEQSFPEAIAWGEDGQGGLKAIGYDVVAMLAALIQEVADLDDRLERFER